MPRSADGPILGEVASTVFTRDVLRLPSSAWRRFRSEHSWALTEPGDASAVDSLRRRSMACVYAERSRLRRQQALLEREARVHELERENALLRQQVAVLELEIQLNQ